MPQRLWLREELLQVLELYCLTPFGRFHSRNPDIRRLAVSIDRTPSAVALKLANFASLDPTLAQSGMANSSRLDREVWAEFFDTMSWSLAAGDQNAGIKVLEEAAMPFEPFPIREGLDVPRLVKTRLNQDFFRQLVLTAYDQKCALTELDAPELLVASHIIPWSHDHALRLAPRNGICLNALHDKAFDTGLIAFDDDYSVVYSRHLPTSTREALQSLGSHKLRMPSRFMPDREFLSFHRQNTFRGD